MTVIAAMKRRGRIAISSDRGVFYGGVVSHCETKVYSTPFGFYGQSGCVAALQAAEPVLKACKGLDKGKRRRKLIEGLREALKAQGWTAQDAKGAPVHEGLSLVLADRATRGLWSIGSSLSLIREDEGIAVAGAGYEVALGAMLASPEERSATECVEAAVRAACTVSVWCSKPGPTSVIDLEGVN